jgi:hypothetical protein
MSQSPSLVLHLPGRCNASNHPVILIVSRTIIPVTYDFVGFI